MSGYQNGRSGPSSVPGFERSAPRPYARADAPRARHARLPSGGRPPARLRDRRHRGRVPALRLRAAGNAGAREHRDADRQVRRRRRQADLQGAPPRRARVVGRDRSGAALRSDVPLARVVAEHRGKLPKFFKRYQIQPVWRADRPARGRFREFYQCDVDAIGSRSMVVETELCAAVSDVLETLGFQDFAVRLNHRELLAAILETAGVPADAAWRRARRARQARQDRRDGVAPELEARRSRGSAAAARA